MSKKAIIEMGDYSLLSHQFIGNKILSNNYNLSSSKEFLVDIRNRKLKIILEGELVNIKLISLPAVSSKNLLTLIKDELLYYYNISDNVVFNYVILNKHKTSIDTAVFIVDSRKISYINEGASNNVKIQGVYLIQLCFLNYFKKRFKDKNYIFTFIYHHSLYLLYCIDNIIRHNYIYKDFQTIDSLETILLSFIESSNICDEVEIKVIYLANFSTRETIPNNIENYACVDLGNIDYKNFLNFIKENR
ncbi:hypothetical protein JK636_19620 [Clostridium sp. YIM B02515]|uniref:Uncharacterized protein n=1 Tax=Clostridium rhizosphaerae TaxID=2803861 RepID=A0ABS1TEX7_9CLOT|nr:hypothetical protein [Clostridium rhizosphaerae]MBL4937922.1 hypothetical protein [Clostridium rhizosphaerae]